MLRERMPKLGRNDEESKMSLLEENLFKMRYGEMLTVLDAGKEFIN